MGAKARETRLVRIAHGASARTEPSAKNTASLRDERSARMTAKIAVSESEIGRHSAERESTAPAPAMIIADFRRIPSTIRVTDESRRSVNNVSALTAEVRATPVGKMAQ